MKNEPRMRIAESHQPLFTFLGVVEEGGERLAQFNMQMGSELRSVTRTAEKLTNEVTRARENLNNWSSNVDTYGRDSNRAHQENARHNLVAFEAALKASRQWD